MALFLRTERKRQWWKLIFQPIQCLLWIIMHRRAAAKLVERFEVGCGYQSGKKSILKSLFNNEMILNVHDNAVRMLESK